MTAVGLALWGPQVSESEALTSFKQENHINKEASSLEDANRKPHVLVFKWELSTGIHGGPSTRMSKEPEEPVTV